uniref:DNA-directed RNA polymerase n=1 Tax=Boodleopsis pusilla TaxID=381415 RepID=A0A386AZC8_9CHLO|nr:RNA polymerase b-subunit [Boodleopsis pusilla]AYC64799.1 RNA polymerase b-subunit [Boodleopsis pusilla]
MFFLFYKFLFFVSDFLEIQRRSFHKFINFQLGDELAKIPSFSLAQTRSRKPKKIFFPNPSFLKLSLFDFSYRSLIQIKKILPKPFFLKKKEKRKMCFVYQDFRYIHPTFTIEESILLSKTYCCQFYVPIQLNNVTQWILLGSLPLLTRRGHFIINGTPRVVINQIVRRPGIYFHRNPQFFYAEIISERGPWIRLEIDKKEKIWVSLASQKRGLTRMSLSFFFQSFYPKYIDLLDSETTINAFKHSQKRLNNFEPRYHILGGSPLAFFIHIFKKKLSTLSRMHFFNFGLFITYRRSPYFKHFSKHVFHLNVLTKSRKGPKSKHRVAGVIDPEKVVHLLLASSSKSANVHFYLGKNGRLRLNKKLGLSLQTRSLTPLDFLMIRHLLFQQCHDQKNLLFDDIDHLKNRKFKTIGDLLQNQLAIGLQRFKKLLKNTKFPQSSFPSISSLKKKKISSLLRDKHWPSARKKPKKSKRVLKNRKLFSVLKFSLLKNQPINSVFKEFFHSHQLSQYLDQSNPLAEITHKRRLSCLGSGGINRETASMEIRGIHPSYYGRICPIETPEGKNAGLVNSLTNMTEMYPNGLLKTPYAEIYKQHEQNHRKLVFLSIDHQDNYNISLNRHLPKFKNISVSRLKIVNFQKCRSSSIDFIASHSQQFLSIATTCIPFIEHDDANRALMGSNMQRQALSLLSCEQPYVTTVNAYRVIADLKDIPTSSMSGLVLYMSQQKMCFYFPRKMGQKKKAFFPLSLNGLFFQEFEQYFGYFQRDVSVMSLKPPMHQNIRFFKGTVPIDFH